MAYGLDRSETQSHPMPMTYGYARVSSTDQDLGLQEAALLAAGCAAVRSEKKTGTTREGRTQLSILLDFLRPGDTLMVTRVDRLARSVGDLQAIVAELRLKGVALKATEQAIDTGSAAGKAFVDMLAVFAEFEHAIRRERQLEGIAKAKAEGRYAGKGRKAAIDTSKIREMAAAGIGASAIAKSLEVGRASVYRALRAA